ncbi:MAG: hypothetical protein KAG61_06670 [Bacteriovoracaceae bacterium]|nr:hypothetical protein [Bacteriovoracaceae bacterium]
MISFIVLLWLSCHSALKLGKDQTVKTEENFKQHITVLRDRENGSTTLLGASITMVISLVAVYFVLISKDRFLRIKDRSHIYLCQYSFIQEMDNYLTGMYRFNRAIEVAYIASKTPPITSEGKIAHRAVQMAQTVYHYSKIKVVAENKWCNRNQKLMLTASTPYIRNIILVPKRDEIGRAVMRKKKWKTVLVGDYILLTNSIVTERGILKTQTVEEVPLS